MKKKEFYDDEFIINLTIDGTSYEEVEVKVAEPNKKIREQINNIVSIFNLPEIDKAGCPIMYLLGRILDNVEDFEILELDDENDYERTLIDYNVQSGDNLHLIAVPAYACPVPMEMEKEWEQYCLHKV